MIRAYGAESKVKLQLMQLTGNLGDKKILVDVSQIEDCLLCRLNLVKLTDTVTKEYSSRENHFGGGE